MTDSFEFKQDGNAEIVEFHVGGVSGRGGAESARWIRGAGSDYDERLTLIRQGVAQAARARALWPRGPRQRMGSTWPQPLRLKQGDQELILPALLLGSGMTAEDVARRLSLRTSVQTVPEPQEQTAGPPPTPSEPDPVVNLQRTGGLSEPYRPASEQPQGVRREPFPFDPDELDRKTREHGVLQNRIERLAANAGFETHSPGAGDPDFDLACRRGEVAIMVEVKTLSVKSEGKQLRLGLGQALDYQFQLARQGLDVSAVLAVDREPSISHWLSLCEQHQVKLLWPDTLEGFFSTQ